MNILFLTICRFDDVEAPGLYTDLMRCFRDNGHNVYVVAPLERRYHQNTELREVHGVRVLGVKTLNMQKCNVIEKGVGILLVEHQFKSAIKHYLGDVKFDLVTYSTPPITFTKAVEWVKNRCHAKTYLQLKDIFPQNAVDICMMKQNSFIHKYFLKKERSLYEASDYIGCMSPRNVEYLLSQNSWLDKNIVEVCPNCEDEALPAGSIKEGESSLSVAQIRAKHGLPTDKTIFVYGGNLGKPQGIDFLIQALKANEKNDMAHFLIVGSGTEYSKLEKYVQTNHHQNVTLHSALPREEYDEIVRACDVGLIFLDYRFSIPNYPSRLLAYLKNGMPVLCATDRSTDIGTMAERNGYGIAAYSDDVSSFNAGLNRFMENPEIIKEMGERGYQFFKENYNPKNAYEIIIKHFE
ncbi:MAG: glycosyltransferase family 4 protein [Paludibacteraceae bacterium]|nr:glycosyltransferase family 4 protein [Paludibacteraceae bacterium]HOU67383.1 glycosyltransferase family 4 protein [Paludibacteraceae bacterium]HQF49529.1 glycosyltransferase family 4 protein [Paludibacteraceae bacterium]HQJ89420.1 glycosyltransferase family 4 protein [Paludibacteraceae bacterium]